MIKFPLNQVGTASKISHASSKFEQEFERRPSLNEIADTLDLPEEKIEEAINVSGRAVSVDAPLSDNEGNSLIDVIPNDSIPDTDEEMLMESLREEISRALNFLDERERVVIESYFGIGQPDPGRDSPEMRTYPRAGSPNPRKSHPQAPQQHEEQAVKKLFR